MSTFEIVQYTPTLPALKVDAESGVSALSWTGHIGKDGRFMLRNAVQWATDSGITGDVEKAFESFFTCARKTFMFQDQDSVMITLRTVISSQSYKIPRPHHDGTYWDKKLNAGRVPFKIGTVLCGPSTLFWDTSSLEKEAEMKVQYLISTEMHQRVDKMGTDTQDIEIRKWATEQLEEMGVPIVRLKKGECAKWVVGDSEKAVIHSEPDMSDMPDGRIL